MKYIDAERLREEIKSIEEDARKVRVAEESTMNQKIGADGQVHLCQKLNLLIDSLQKEQPEEPKIEIAEYYYQKGVFEGLSQGRADALKILEEFMKRKADPVIVIKQQEQPEVDLEKASRNVYESWMGGTMDDVRRDMVELGEVLNARKV